MATALHSYAESLNAKTTVIVNQMGVGIKADMPSKGQVQLKDGKLTSVILVSDVNGLKSDTGDAIDVAKGPLWLNSKQYPTAIFKSNTIMPTKLANQYNVQGHLTIKNVTKPVTLLASVIPKGKTSGDIQTVLTFNRLDYGLGLDSWKDISVVKNNVNLEVKGHYE